ncbi:hypothetical protein KZP23_14565 [Echinicola marina]|uniref:hypothetical protein n=1 Tax=Echinicola marina TaxID=2859768 RepID=UPI001CF64C92|nr:hypothetical protein [Echinicola marina]UCS91946.1 hypothetical protein KZP23_14565 [Echinicola marina]
MKVLRIFECANEKLYAAQYDTDERDALVILQNQWSDPQYLREFFDEFDRDFRKFYGNVNVNKRILETIDEADELIGLLFDLCEEGGDLDEIFKPLDNQEKETSSYSLQALKGKGSHRKSYLRIYALRYGSTYIITGGAIKLTATMQERPHTKTELYKLDLVKRFLKDKNAEGQFVYLDIE